MPDTVAAKRTTKARGEPLDSETLVERVRPLLPSIRERAAENEDARQIIDSSFDDLVEAGIFRALVPRAFGGSERDIRDYLEAIRLIASADPATGWVAGVVSVHGHGLAYFDKKLQEEVWSAGPDITLSTSGAPEGKTTVVEGGIRISGRWRFSSGVDRAAWVMLGAKVPNADSGEDEFFIVAVPKSDFTIDDTWHTSGLRGTGSKDVLVDDAFVPRYRWAGPGYEHIEPAYPALQDNPLYSVPFISVFPAIFVAVALGAAEGAFAVAQEKLRQRVRPLTGQRTIESPAALMRLGESALEIFAATTLVERHWDQLAAATHTAEPVSQEIVGRWHSEDTYAAHMVIRAIDRVFAGAGGSSQYSSNPLQRFWRDLHTIGSHVYFDFDAGMEQAARALLEMSLDPLIK